MKFNLINKDCIEAMKTLPNQSIDLVLTDIPYSEVNQKSAGLRNLDKGKADLMTFDLNEALNEVLRVTKSSIYIFCGINQISQINLKLKRNKFSTRLAQWEKSNPSPMNGKSIWLSGSEFCVFGKKKGAFFARHCEKPIWKYPSMRGKMHPTQKPVLLMEYIIESSCLEGETVLDFTMGSGTTGVACANLNRDFVGIELDETYFNLAKTRIEKARSPLGDLF